MGSRREEERNEKIIRGLLKLPPNRKCINCNSLGPQYVCTNFWTFVCITCSGIHREFTHRVKSVSMAKFTSQEVESLESGGNQRAREIYLKEWDMQRQRLPESSNIDKIREFIKCVYVDKKYAGGKSSDKPPRDTQNYKNHEEERRASSYHSYSQSPPYDYQYEDRRYGKQAGMLTRKPGSDRVQYDGKFSSLIYSPGRTSGMEDRFANEGSAPRLSDFSVSSAGDASRHGGRSPNFQKDAGHSSPPAVPVRNILIEDGRRQTLNTFLEADAKGDSGDIGRAPQSHRPASSESFGYFDSNSPGLRSVKSDSLIDVLERDQPTGIQSASSLSSANTIQASASSVVGNQDFFSFSTASNQQPTSSPQSIDLFAEVNNYAPSAVSSGQNPVTVPLNLSPDFSAEFNNSVASTSLLAENPVTLPLIESEGWATFDMPQNSAFESGRQTMPYSVPTTSGEIPKPPFDAPFSVSNELQWASVKSSYAKAESIDLFSDAWELASHQANTAPVLSTFQPWSAFDDNVKNTQNTDVISFAETNLHIPVQMSSVNSGIKVAEGHGKDFPGLAGGVISGHIGNSAISSFPSPANPSELAPPRKSTNPFDFPCESELVNSSVIVDMSPVQAALPSTPFPTPLPNGAPWFAQFSVPSGPLQYVAPPSSQMPNFSPQGHVASLGGNPFA